MKSKKLSVDIGHFGKWPFQRMFRLNEKKLRMHRHVMGTTGQGKSKMLAHFTTSLILQGVGVCLIDPHSDLCADVLSILIDKGFYKRSDASQKLIYIDFNRRDRFIPFNVLNQPYPVDEVARNLVEVCTRAWAALADGAAPLFENIMLYSVPVLVENNLPLTSLDDLLTNKDFRETLLEKCTDVKIINFFHNQFDQWGRDQPTMIGSALRRASLLSYTPALRYSLGQKENILNFRKLMDSQTSVIADLGGLDEQTQKILGCLFTVGMEVACLSRADIPEKQRKLYMLVMDEFSQFSAQSEEALSRVLSLARKYGLFLTLAHQTWSQLSERLQGALQNSMPMYFRLGYDDAVWAAPRLGRSNPYHVKHEVKPAGGKQLPFEHHPAYFQMQEEYEIWTRKIEDLHPQQMFVKYPRSLPYPFSRLFSAFKTREVRTLTLPPFRCTLKDVEKIKNQYAMQLMKPIGEIAVSSQAPAAASNISTLSRRKQRK